MHPSAGFSLIELMAVVAIVSILAVISIPSYQHYIERARFAEVITATEPYKLAISIALQSGFEQSTLNNGQYGIPAPPTPTQNLESLLVDHGRIIAKATRAASGTTYILTPNEDGGLWEVSGSCLTQGICHV